MIIQTIFDAVQGDNSKGIVLISPLDWGLGHATRCVPLIRILLSNKFTVLIAASGPSAILLKNEFPDCIHLSAPEARFLYSRSRRWFALSVIIQIPKLLRLAKRETAWLRSVCKKYKPDLIISDNRFGMYHNNIASVFISHQPGLKTGFGERIDKLVQKQKFKALNRFTECWIPDLKGDAAIAGELSNPDFLPKIPVHFIGLLSRLESVKQTESGRILILLSGPEPQRTLLEEIISEQLDDVEENIIFVRGLPSGGPAIRKKDRVTYHDHLDARQLSEAVCMAEFVVCRSGYSSVMDLLKLGKKGIYIPTPGQPEQEYLARRLSERNQGIVFRQEDFILKTAIELARSFNFHLPQIPASDIFLKRVKAMTGS